MLKDFIKAISIAWNRICLNTTIDSEPNVNRLLNRIKNFGIRERFETDKQTYIKHTWVNEIFTKKDEIYNNSWCASVIVNAFWFFYQKLPIFSKRMSNKVKFWKTIASCNF